MPAPVSYTKAKDDPLHRVNLIRSDVSCETVGQNYIAFQVLRGSMQYRAVCIFTKDGEDWEVYPYRNGKRLRIPMKDGPTAVSPKHTSPVTVRRTGRQATTEARPCETWTPTTSKPAQLLMPHRLPQRRTQSTRS